MPDIEELLRLGESVSVDFKLECKALNRKYPEYKAANAELIKDIIAMSNNLGSVSYIVIGVADDGRHYKDVENEKLNEENLQYLCRTYINPFPQVKLLNITHHKTNLKVIEIGPHLSGGFSFKKNLIDYSQKYCFKENEVWIRRGRTSDLAMPKEISKLISKEYEEFLLNAFIGEEQKSSVVYVDFKNFNIEYFESYRLEIIDCLSSKLESALYIRFSTDQGETYNSLESKEYSWRLDQYTHNDNDNKIMLARPLSQTTHLPLHGNILIYPRQAYTTGRIELVRGTEATNGSFQFQSGQISSGIRIFFIPGAFASGKFYLYGRRSVK